MYQFRLCSENEGKRAWGESASHHTAGSGGFRSSALWRKNLLGDKSDKDQGRRLNV